MARGVGRWVQILEDGLLPGKLIQQLNGQTQRLLGQQSLAAFTGLRVDVDAVRRDNAVRAGAARKGGLVINVGDNPRPEAREAARRAKQAEYGLAPEAVAAAEAELEARKRAAAERAAAAAAAPRRPASRAGPRPDARALPRAAREELLLRMRARLARRREREAAVRRDGPSPTADRENFGAVAARRPPGAAKRKPSAGGGGGGGGGGGKRGGGGGGKRGGGGGKRGGRRASTSSGSEEEEEEKGGGGPARGAADVALAADVATLTAMGFGARRAREALEEAGGDVEGAVEWLMASCV
jgi:hypothetical protein